MKDTSHDQPSRSARKLNPGDHYQTPRHVLAATDLSTADKVETLTNWANEIRQLQVAEEENMGGAPGPAEQLAAVEQALLSLGEHDAGHDAKA